MTKTDIKVGAIGCGQFMRSQHIQTIARSEKLTLCFLVDINEQKLDEVCTLYSPKKKSTDWREVVQDSEVEVVVVGIEPKFHPEIAVAALESGKPVYVEKPLAETIDEGRKIQEVAERTKLPVAVGFNRRCSPAVEWIDRQLANHAGPLTMWYRICDDDRVRPADQQWKKKDRLLTEAVHIFDLFYYFAQSEPCRVYATEARTNDALVTLEFSNGSQATLLSSSLSSLEQPKERFEAVLNQAAVEMDDFVEGRTYGNLPGPSRICFAGRAYDGCNNEHVQNFKERGLAGMVDLRKRYVQGLEDPPIPQINYTADKGWGRALEEFCLNAIRGEGFRNANVVDGIRATACALAARRSIETKEAVSTSSLASMLKSC